jgi:pyridoxine/pyridoxamine 5'-phosphate oxidase
MPDRPQMPAVYGVPVDPDGQLSWPDVAERLSAARNYWLCTTRPDGRPHAMPVWGLWLDGCVVFSTDPASRKGRNLAARPAAVVHLESGDDVVVVEGMVAPFDGDVAVFTDRYEAKYAFRPELGPTQGLYAMRSRVVMAWRERDFPRSATRWALD